LKSEKIPPLYIAIDTSGSIDDRQLSAFQSEIQAIMDTYPTEITCIYCDSEINGKEYFSPDSPVIFTKAKGGGGTDFRPIFDHIKEEPDPPECLIVLTDLEGTFPEAGPPYPVLWVNTYNRQNAPFGIIVHMEGTF
jgi:predicted metal-dependent peptidase